MAINNKILSPYPDRSFFLALASCDLKHHSYYNLKTAHATATRLTQNDVLIISIF